MSLFVSKYSSRTNKRLSVHQHIRRCVVLFVEDRSGDRSPDVLELLQISWEESSVKQGVGQDKVVPGLN